MLHLCRNSARWNRLPGILSSRCIVLPASNLNRILDEQTGNLVREAYAGVPLSIVSASLRGNTLADLARMIDYEQHPNSMFEDAHLGRCTNGIRRGSANAEYDWRRDGLRIECKSAMMKWIPSSRRWVVQFLGVKFAERGVRKHALFDELLLVLFTPRNVYFYRHDGEFGLSRRGASTSNRGHSVQIVDPRGLEDWADSLKRIMDKFDAGSNGCSRLAALPISDSRISRILDKRRNATHQVFSGIPLGNMTPFRRASRIRAAVRCVDAIVNRDPKFDLTCQGFCSWIADQNDHCDHRKSKFCWRRGRVKCKIGQLCFDPKANQWKVRFARIQMSHGQEEYNVCFDELVLGMYTPRGIYIYTDMIWYLGDHNVGWAQNSS